MTNLSNTQNIFDQDLSELVKVRYIPGNLFSQDNGGNEIGVRCFYKGEPNSIAGNIVSANVIRADGVTVPLTGAIYGDDNNIALVNLTGDCYEVPGAITIVIKITGTYRTTTIGAFITNNYLSATGTVVDPGSFLPSIQSLISSINTAVASIPAGWEIMWQTFAPAFSISTNYTAGQYVTYGDPAHLYRFTSDHTAGVWNSSHVTAVNVGSELSSKADLRVVAPPFYNETDYVTGQYVTYNGKLWRFTSDHPAGAWNSSHVTEDFVGYELHNIDVNWRAAAVNLSGQKTDLTVIAPAFYEGTDYVKGQYVIYYGKLYRFDVNHSAGAWNSLHATEVYIGSQLNNIDANWRAEVVDLKADKANLSIIASQFYADVVYYTGQYVIHDGKLYKFTSDHPAGAWNSAHVTEDFIGYELSNIDANWRAGVIEVKLGKTNLTVIAPPFYADVAYYKGQYVTHDGKCYKFTSDHPAGAWNSGHVTEVYIGSELSNIDANWRAEVVDLKNGKADTVLLAPAFYAGTSYVIGQYVTYSGKLYRFTLDHPAGAWNSSHVAEVSAGLDLNNHAQEIDTLNEDVENIKGAINSMTEGNPMLTWEWIQGNWSDLSEDPPTSYSTGTTRIRSVITINVKSKVSLTCKSGYKYIYSLYVDGVRKEYKSGTWQTSDAEFEYGAGTYVLYIALCKSNNADIVPVEARDGIVLLADNAVENIYDAIAQNAADLDAMNTGTVSDVGKALLAKTVVDGKVKEWEFGEAGGGGAEIDDTAGAGITDKTWSANKLTSEFGQDREILKKLEFIVPQEWTWEQGNYSDISQDPPTSTSTAATRIRTTFTIDASKKVSMITQNGYKCIYSIYKDGTRLEYQSSSFITLDKIWEGAGEYTFYVALANSAGTNIAPSEADNALVVLVDNEVLNIYDAIADNTDAIKDVDKKHSDAFAEAFPGNPMFTLQWLLGGYSDLANDPPVNYNTGNTRARLKVSVDVKSKLTVSCANGYKYVYSVYKGETRQTYKSSSWSTDAEKDFEYGEGTYTLYMNCASSSDTAITVDEAKSAITILADNAVLNIYDAISTIDALKETKNLYDPGASNTLRGYYNASNTWVTSYDFGQTDYIPVKQGVQYISSLLSTAVLWFDENKDFLQSTASSAYKGWITPPSGAAYAKFMIRISDHTSFYVYSNEPDSVQVPLDVIPYGLYNQYAGKKAVAFGTSLTYRAKSSGGYLEYLPEMAQITVDNQGLGNSTILEHQDHTDMMGMITGYTGYADKDVVLLEGFVNDWYDNSDKLGTWKDEGVVTSTTVCGRIRYAINYILTQNPHTTLIMILDPYGQAYNGNAGCASTVVKSGYTQMEYYDEIAKLAASLGIPTIKGYAISGMNELVSDYYIDIIHPSPLGAKQFADVVWSAMKNIPIKSK